MGNPDRIRPAMYLKRLKDEAIFSCSERTLADIRVEVIMPSLTALFGDSPRKLLCNGRPFLRTKLVDQRSQEIILFQSPRPFNYVRVQNLLPTVETLYLFQMETIRQVI